MRVLVLVVLAAAGIALGASWRVPRALACTGPGAVDAMLTTPVIVEGRVAEVRAAVPGVPERPGHSPVVLTISVERAHRGASAGQRIDALAYLPAPGVPQPCPAFEFQGDLVGTYLVIGLSQPENAAGLPVAERGAASFVGDEPAGLDYERGHAIAAMISDSDPAGALLTLVPASPACGDTVRVTGRRFSPGRHLIRGAFDARTLALVQAAADGSFEATITLTLSDCSRADNNGRIRALHVYRFDPPSPGTTIPNLALAEIAPLTIAGAVDAPDAGLPLEVTPRPAHCGEPVSVSGRGFLPGERLLLGYEPGGPVQQVVASPAGRFVADLRLPADACAGVEGPNGGGIGTVWVSQADFDLPRVPAFALAIGEVYLAPLASQAGIVFETDKTVYYYPSDTSVQVSVHGLTGCVGKPVQIGLAIVQFDGATFTVEVDASGSAHAVLPLPATSFADRRVAVAGDCVPGRFAVSAQTIAIIPREPPGPANTPTAAATVLPAPGPPDAGSGSAASGLGAWGSLVGAVAAAGLVVGLALVARRRAG